MCLIFVSSSCFALNFNGTYTFSKGVNKSNGTLMFIQFKPDSAFFILHTISGMPDFNTTEIMGFCAINEQTGIFIGKSSQELKFIFTSTSCSISENANCNYACTTVGKYKKIATSIKKGNDFMPAFSDKSGLILDDSVSCYPIPRTELKSKLILHKNMIVSIHDEFNEYYLIETDKLKNEFLWVAKKYIRLKKSK